MSARANNHDPLDSANLERLAPFLMLLDLKLTRRRSTVKMSKRRGFLSHPSLWPCAGCKKIDGRKGKNGIQCDDCDEWWHASCGNVELDSATQRSWRCPRCTQRLSSQVLMICCCFIDGLCKFLCAPATNSRLLLTKQFKLVLE